MGDRLFDADVMGVDEGDAFDAQFEAIADAESDAKAVDAAAMDGAVAQATGETAAQVEDAIEEFGISDGELYE